MKSLALPAASVAPTSAEDHWSHSGNASTGSPVNAPEVDVPWWHAVILTAMAGGLGWGIRGQFGHESGAMIAGLLVSLVLARLFCPRAEAAVVIRAVAWGTIAIGFGGSMTYGQTVGLTHDAPLVGNWAALRWGLLGLAIKGGIWIGFAGTFLGMGLGGVVYRARWMVPLWLGVLGLVAIGIRWINEPFDPAQHILPRIYFSDDWLWEPGAALKPRREVWGGMLLGLLGLLAFIRVRLGDVLGFRLGLWGFLGGALGFPLGQCLQAYHAWNPAIFHSGPWVTIDPLINWWNFMETTFGLVLGAGLGLGVWLNRRRIVLPPRGNTREIPPWIEVILLVVHSGLLVTSEFFGVVWVDRIYDFGMLLGFIPLVAVAGGRWWPYFLILPVTAVPILGKTVRQLVYQEPSVPAWLGWVLYGVIPLIGVTFLAVRWAQSDRRARPAAEVLRPCLLVATWLYFSLNFAFFHFPWPWSAWTSRTPNSLVYWICAFGLSWCAGRRSAGEVTGIRAK